MEFVSPFARHAKKALIAAAVVAALSAVTSGVSYATENHLYNLVVEANYSLCEKMHIPY